MERFEKHKKEFDINCTSISGDFEGILIMSTNTDKPHISANSLLDYYEIPYSNRYEELPNIFDKNYNLYDTTSTITKHWDNFLTQNYELYLEKETTTPIIVTGEFPTVMYDIYKIFLNKYETEIIQECSKNTSSQQLKKKLNENWENMTGTQIDSLRRKINKNQNYIIKKDILERIHNNLNIIEIWRNLRNPDKIKNHLEYGWDCGNDIREKNINETWETLT